MNDAPRSTKTIARVVGALFIAAMFAYAIGNGLVESTLGAPDFITRDATGRAEANLGAALMLANSVFVVAIGALLFPILRQYDRRIAFTYAAARLIEAAALAFGVFGLLSLVGVRDAYHVSGGDPAPFQAAAALAVRRNFLAYQLAMIVLGLGSIPLCFVLYRARLVPRPLAVWGLAGYACLFIGALFELLGAKVGVLFAIPGGLFELALPLWLFIKGLAPRERVSA